MPELTVELTWPEWEYLEAVADAEEISLDEVVFYNFIQSIFILHDKFVKSS